MWGRGTGQDEVTCIACGTECSRAEAREYDKQGNRWERAGKTFEYMCKDCHGDLCHQPRRGLETTLVAAGAGTAARGAFLAAFAGHDDADADQQPGSERRPDSGGES